MAKKSKQEKKDQKPLTQRDIMKWEIATELGLDEKVNSVGWSGLTAAESGRIGGLLASRNRGNRD